jgi:acyl carrier protein
MLDNKMFPDDLKMQLEKFTNELNKYNSANSEDSISDLITLKGRTDDNYTDSERCIARKCYETFGYSEIDINDGFEMYNSDSLQMTTLYGKLRSEYNINLTDLYKYDSIRKLAEKIESNKMDIYKTKEKILEIYNKGIMESRDYYTDSRLMYAELIQKLNVIDFKVKKCYNNVMVTGVTGYLGIYILHELLENTEVKVSLIIRRMDNVSAEERLRGKIGKYFGSEFFDKYMERINVYEGDMFDTGFGLGETYSCLKEEVDCIVHCAARSIVKLMSLSAYKCDNFHIGNPNTTELKDCLSDSRNIIHSELVSLSDFLDKGIEFFESSSSKFSIFNDILIHCFDGGNIQEDYRASEVGDDFTNSILEKMNFHWPELTPKVFNKYLSHCISVGFIKES